MADWTPEEEAEIAEIAEEMRAAYRARQRDEAKYREAGRRANLPLPADPRLRPDSSWVTTEPIDGKRKWWRRG